ncbi:MAG: hypothetical protein ACE5E5_13710 [Phycisphaerae bacterium]
MLQHHCGFARATLVGGLITLSGCAAGGRVVDQATTAPRSPKSASLIFPPTGTLAFSRVDEAAKDRLPGATIPWEVTKIQSGGRMRISAVRHNGNVTEYYTSSSGPNGSTGRRRVVSRSTNIPHGHRHRP